MGAVLLRAAPLLDSCIERLVWTPDRGPAAEEPFEYRFVGRSRIIRLFGSGVLTGLILLVPGRAQSPFAEAMDLDQAIRRSGCDPERVLGTPAAGRADFPRDPRDVAEVLVAIDPPLEDAVYACYRLATRGHAFVFNTPCLRLIFFAGMVAAGVTIPRRGSSHTDRPSTQGRRSDHVRRTCP